MTLTPAPLPWRERDRRTRISLLEAVMKKHIDSKILKYVSRARAHFAGAARLMNDPHPCPSPLEGEGKRERGLYQLKKAGAK